MAQRIPPHNEDAERSVLGAAMTSNDAMLNIAETLIPDALLPYPTYDKLLFGVK